MWNCKESTYIFFMLLETKRRKENHWFKDEENKEDKEEIIRVKKKNEFRQSIHRKGSCKPQRDLQDKSQRSLRLSLLSECVGGLDCHLFPAQGGILRLEIKDQKELRQRASNLS